MNTLLIFLATIASFQESGLPTREVKINQHLMMEAILEGRSGEATKEMSLEAKSLTQQEMMESHGFGRKEAERLFSAQKVQSVVSLKVTGLPKYQAFFLHQMRADGSSSNPLHLRVDKEGQVQYFTDQKPQLLENFLIHLSGFDPHEPIHFVITSERGDIYLSTTSFPNQPEVISKSGAKLRVEAMDPLATFFLIKGEGFDSKEPFDFISTSCNEGQSQSMQAGLDGTIFFSCSPIVKGKTGGDARVEIYRKNGEELSLDYKWGKNTLDSLIKR